MKYCTCVTSRHSVTIADLNEAIAHQSFDSYDACHEYFVKKVYHLLMMTIKVSYYFVY